MIKLRGLIADKWGDQSQNKRCDNKNNGQSNAGSWVKEGM